MEKIDFVVLGARVREKREEQGISQEQLSELSGLSTVYISLIENARKKPSLSSLLKVCNALNVTMDELLVGNQTPSEKDYQSDISLLLMQISPMEKRFITSMVRHMVSFFRDNAITVTKK